MMDDFPCVVGQADHVLAQFLAHIGQETINQQRKILLALAQGRQADAEFRQPVVQIAAKRLLFHRGLKIRIGRRDHAEIHGLLARATDAVNSTRLQNPQQLRLHRHRQVGDFIQENGAALGQFERACLGLMGPGERSFLVPEQFALDQLFRDGAAVHHNQRLGCAQALRMDRSRHQLLPGPGFAGHQDREIGRRDQFHFGHDASDRSAGSHGIQQRGGLRRPVAQLPQPALGHPLLEGPAQRQQQLVVLERLGHIVVGPRPD